MEAHNGGIMSYYNKFGLVNAFNFENVSENCPIITLELLILFYGADNPRITDGKLFRNLQSYTFNCRTPISGLYDNMPLDEYVHERDAFCSPDQLIIYILVNYMIGNRAELKNIYKYLRNNFCTYNNITGEIDFKRLMQPLAVFASAYSVGKCWAKLPLGICIEYSVKSNESKGTTSGILKSWVVDQVFRLGWFSEDYPIRDVFVKYFGHESQQDHPIRILIRGEPVEL
jgi:hypothetical protein